MRKPLVLASGSPVRAQLLRNAGLDLEIHPGRIDEVAVKQAMLNDNSSPRDIADQLAEMKAAKIAGKHPDALVIGCDQVLDQEGTLLSKPDSQSGAIEQLHWLNGKTHVLHSACVVFDNAQPAWRNIGRATLQMRELSDDYIASYVARNWTSIRDTVGCYKLEEEGCRLFSAINGDYFSVLGIPLLPLLNWLAIRGMIDS